MVESSARRVYINQAQNIYCENETIIYEAPGDNSFFMDRTH